MGAVYEARHQKLDRRVALKTLHPEYAGSRDSVARFFNEAKVLSRLEHPSIVQVIDFGQADDGTAYLVMEYLRGESLAHRFQAVFSRGERISPSTAMQFGWQIADTLAIAHSQGIVHRDIKPENLMLVADAVAPGGERVKILDFGIAKLTDERDKNGVKTDTQAVMGTPLYMSPEQCSGAGGVDAKTDVYALGCVLYQALAGRPPFLAEGAGQLIGMHLFQEPQPLSRHAPKAPSAVVDLIHRLLTKDKTKRPSMSEAADSIGRISSKLTGAGVLIRSRAPAVTDPDATQNLGGTPASTTLGQSIGQHDVARRSRIRLFGLAVCSLVLVASMTFIVRRSIVKPAAPPNDTRLEQPITAPSPPAQISWTIETTPTGATILDAAGKSLGITPWHVEQNAEAGSISFIVRKNGYQDEQLQIKRDENTIRKLTLTKNVVTIKRAEPTKSTRVEPRALPKEKAAPPKNNKVGYED